jgi:hypothetical protein
MLRAGSFRILYDTELDPFETEITAALSKLCQCREVKQWDFARWTREVKEAVGNLMRSRGHEWYAHGPHNVEWLWDGVAWEISKGGRPGWVLRQPLVMESEWGGSYSVTDDFQRLMVARADHRLLVFGAQTEAEANDLIKDCINGISDFRHTLPGDRYLFAAWLNEKGNEAHQFVYRLFVA